MDWVDYREKLTIGISDDGKLQMLKNKINAILSGYGDFYYNMNEYYSFCIYTGIRFRQYPGVNNYLSGILSTIDSEEKLIGVIAYYIAFVNSKTEQEYDIYSKKDLVDILLNCLSEIKVGYELVETDDGNYFVFPKGAKLLDEKLVSEPLMWLEQYPKTYKLYCIALRQYSEGAYIRDVADNFRKSFEEFAKEFFSNSKNLNSNINEIGTYLKENQVDTEISNSLVSLVGCYNKLNNRTAKHNDSVDPRTLEYIMYQTGVFIRMLIVIKTGKESNSKK